MARLLGPDGQPVDPVKLKSEIAGAKIATVRSPLSSYPADGLEPVRLANILREADAGHPVRQLELYEAIEERDPHYIGVLGTRRRSVSQIPITIEAASDSPEDEARAQMVRDWLARDELTEEVFDILDCIGKGYSFTEIIWDTSEGQWMPAKLEWRDPRWFRFDRLALKTPMLITGSLAEEPLPWGKFIFAKIAAKSGLTLRSGLTRVAAWGYMYKMFTQKDWAIFTQNYGQPIRVGRFSPQATEEQQDTLYRAVAQIAGDCGAIIPEDMRIDFIESGNLGAAAGLYKERADWLDQQISKAVLGQTATTDAVVGGLGSGKEHRAVQKDIETADAKALAAILNRDLIRPWMQLNFGPLKRYPRLKIEQPEQEDLKAMSEAIVPLIDRGLEIDQATIMGKFGLPEPKPGAKLLRPQSGAPVAPVESPLAAPLNGQSAVFERSAPSAGITTALQAEGASAAKPRDGSNDAAPALGDRAAIEAQAPMEAMLGQIEAMLQTAGSLEEFRTMLLAAFPKLDSGPLAGVLAQALTVANATGRADVEAENG
ncbi:DUF935 domain-containing protein [Rhodobacter capsulatus]|uniref:DUF935 domain-containing protein n=1 Tax=Rhodobacter capsulatus TaxID=1061 RepID=UPI0040293326